MRNRQMIVHWLLANSKAIEKRERDNKTFYVMVDAQAFREGVGRLLAEVQRIKAEGDLPAARKLFDTHGIHFDPALRDQVIARFKATNPPSYTGFVMPKLQPVTDANGADHGRDDFVSEGLHRADAGVLGRDEGHPRRVSGGRTGAVGRRRRDHVVVHVDHPADEALQVALDEGLVDRVAEIRVVTARCPRTQGVEVGRVQEQLARDERRDRRSPARLGDGARHVGPLHPKEAAMILRPLEGEQPELLPPVRDTAEAHTVFGDLFDQDWTA